MHPTYDDITSRIAEAPSWWQEDGVPRWGEFSPGMASSIYAREVALMEIACQSCGKTYRVAMCRTGHESDSTIADKIVQGHLHYGDPPNSMHAEDCGGGASMNSEPVRILEYWSTHNQRYVENGIVKDYERYFAWERNPLLEGKYDGWNGQTRPAGPSDA